MILKNENSLDILGGASILLMINFEKKIFSVTFIKAVSSVVALFNLYLAQRLLSPEDFGLFVYIIALVGFSLFLIKSGLTILVMKSTILANINMHNFQKTYIINLWPVFALKYIIILFYLVIDTTDAAILCFLSLFIFLNWLQLNCLILRLEDRIFHYQVIEGLLFPLAWCVLQLFILGMGPEIISLNTFLYLSCIPLIMAIISIYFYMRQKYPINIFLGEYEGGLKLLSYYQNIFLTMLANVSTAYKIYGLFLIAGFYLEKTVVGELKYNLTIILVAEQFRQVIHAAFGNDERKLLVSRDHDIRRLFLKLCLICAVVGVAWSVLLFNFLVPILGLFEFDLLGKFVAIIGVTIFMMSGDSRYVCHVLNKQKQLLFIGILYIVVSSYAFAVLMDLSSLLLVQICVLAFSELVVLIMAWFFVNRIL